MWFKRCDRARRARAGAGFCQGLLITYVLDWRALRRAGMSLYAEAESLARNSPRKMV